MFAFLLLLFVLLVIYYFTVSNEGFNPMNTSPSHVVNIPVPAIPAVLSPATSDLSSGKIQDTVKPSDMPGQLPHSQYDQIAASSPLPYQDTALIKANRQQMINLLEMLKGFLAFEAQEIAERSDPSIQLPLQTARSDFQSLQNEVQVLNRNPGIQPTITLSHLNDISSNLAYLQEKVRLIGAAGPIQGPIYQFTKPVEGFQGMNGSMQPDEPTRSRTVPPPRINYFASGIVPANSAQSSIVPTSNTDSSAAAASVSTSNGQMASLADLNAAITRMDAESMNISASGTSSPEVESRIVAIARGKSVFQDLINSIQDGVISESEIKLTKKK